MEKTLIKTAQAGVKYFLNYEDRPGSRGTVRSLLHRKKRKELWALRDLSLEIKSGEIFGVIGSNGAGKSTLLKAIAGIIPVTEGKISVDGTIAPLIELGAAFNQELTGAENIYLSGSIYRIPRKTIRENFDKIVDFSGLRRFIHTPVKNYSSGMFIRLAFSIVIFFKPDVVLIDEVFSVGDAVFQQRSFEKMLFFKERGAAIVLVTHDLNLISQICGRALVLSRGKASFLGGAEEAISHYLQLIKSREGLEEDARRPEPGAVAAAEDSRRWGNRKVEIVGVDFVDKEGNRKNVFATGEYFEARLTYVSHAAGVKAVFGAAFNTIYKMLIYGPNTLESDFPDSLPERGTVRFIVPRLPLFEGDYLFSASVYDPSLTVAYDHHEMMYFFRVISPGGRDFGCVRIDSRWEITSD
jgi:ABC-type polysaccharide/polyol phosphate transport system ATPase subunit